MDAQTAFNILLGLSAFLGGWVLNSLRESIKSLQAADSQLADKVQHIEILVAGKYVQRDDMERLMDKLSSTLFNKLDKIENKLDGKMDRP